MTEQGIRNEERAGPPRVHSPIPVPGSVIPSFHAPALSRDLRGIPCPASFARAAEAVEDLDPGETIEFLLDPGKPARDVANSLVQDGHELLERFDDGDRARVVLRKTGDLPVRPAPSLQPPGSSLYSPRHLRQELLPGYGPASTLRFAAARVRLAGEGPALSWASHYLAGAGVGTILLPPAGGGPCDRVIELRRGEPVEALLEASLAAARCLDELVGTRNEES